MISYKIEIVKVYEVKSEVANEFFKKIKEWLNTFTPFNEQEQVDCQYIRQFLEEEANLLLRDNVKMHFTASAWVLNRKR